MTAIVELKNVTKAVSNGMNEEKVILDDVSLEIREHDFITILGGNGAGKSTLFNTIAGTLPVSSGKIYILGEDVTNYSPEKRAKYLSRVFQDPKMGTAPRMTVAENLLVAKFRGEKRGLIPRHLASYKEEFQTVLAKIGNGLENHIDTAVEFLSGGATTSLESVDGDTETPRTLASRRTHCSLGSKNQSGPHDLDGSVCETRCPHSSYDHPPYGRCFEIWKSLDRHERRAHRPRPQSRRKSPNDHRRLLSIV